MPKNVREFADMGISCITDGPRRHQNGHWDECVWSRAIKTGGDFHEKFTKVTAP
jgi:hypothetical protein